MVKNEILNVDAFGRIAGGRQLITSTAKHRQPKFIFAFCPAAFLLLFVAGTSYSWTVNTIATKNGLVVTDMSSSPLRTASSPLSRRGQRRSVSLHHFSTEGNQEIDETGDDTEENKNCLGILDKTSDLLLSSSNLRDQHDPPQKLNGENTKTPKQLFPINELVVVLNTNAKGVNVELVEASQALLSALSGRYSIQMRTIATTTYEEARNAANDIVTSRENRTRTLIVPVGGDGTLTTTINLLWESLQSKSPANGNNNTSASVESTENNARNGDGEAFPFVFGYIAMGTGNALGSVVGCTPRKQQGKRLRAQMFLKKIVSPKRTKVENFRLVLQQLVEATFVSQKTSDSSLKRSTISQKKTKKWPLSSPTDVDIVEVPLIRVRSTQQVERTNGAVSTSSVVNDQYAFFAGVGYDSLLLQDYKDLQEWTSSKQRKNRFWQVATTGVVGYTVAMFTRSLPKLLRLKHASRLLKDVRITTNQPQTTYWIDHRRGDFMRAVAGGSSQNNEDFQYQLYRGSAGIVSAGTVPFYGGGLRLFPFARMTPVGMHLRIARDLHPVEGIFHIPSIFQGSYRERNSFKCLDFVGNHFAIEIFESYNASEEIDHQNEAVEVGFPVQHSGESLGRCTRLEFQVSQSEQEFNKQRMQALPPVSQENDVEGYQSCSMPPHVAFITLMPPRFDSEEYLDF